MTVAWFLTIAECLFGFWLTTIGWPIAGGIIIGSALAFQLCRMSVAAWVRQMGRSTP